MDCFAIKILHEEEALPRGGWRAGTAMLLMGACACAALGLVGCAAPGPDSPWGGATRAEPLEQNIVRIAAYYPSHNPWIWDDARTRVRGIVISALYLEGPDVLGVFGDGVIRPRLYLYDPAGAANTQTHLVKEWSFDVEEARPFRSTKRTLLGNGYRFHLIWGDELDLSGQSIRMVVVFDRRDGTLIYSGKKDFRVPNSGT